MPRYHKRADPKELKRSLEMLREVARRRAEMDAESPLFPLNKDETGRKGRTPEERRLVDEHNLRRNWLHFERGWPWEELPTATAMLKAHRELKSDPFSRAMMSTQ
jgi:hypothetical protein